MKPARRSAHTGQQMSQHGMALIEVLVSIVLFAFGLLGLLGLEAATINLSVDAEDRSRASLFADEMSSYMWANASVTVPASQVTTWNTNCNDITTVTALPQCVVGVTPVTANSANIAITWIDQKHTQHQLTTQVILP